MPTLKHLRAYLHLQSGVRLLLLLVQELSADCVAVAHSVVIVVVLRGGLQSVRLLRMVRMLCLVINHWHFNCAARN